MNPNPFLNNKALECKKITILALILILLISLAQFASFTLIQNHVTAFYGAQTEDISMAVLSTYAGIVTMLPIQFRLLRYFTMKKYLLTVFSLGIAINFGSFITHDLVVFIVLRFFQGNIVAIGAGSMLIVIFSILPEAKKSIIGSSIFFGVLLSTSVIIGMLSSWVAVNMDWNYIYFGLIALQLIALLICLSIFRSKMILKPYPIYQLDWVGTLFFGIFSTSLAYVMIYGPKQYWFADSSIQMVSILGFVMLLFFLYRQYSLKRPLVDLSVFKYGKFLLGLFLLLLFFGIKDTINLIYGYAGSILGWSATDVINLGFYNITGVIIAIWFSAKAILKNKQNLPKLLTTGFVLMILYNLWMYYFLTPNLAFSDLVLPVFIQGTASDVHHVRRASINRNDGNNCLFLCSIYCQSKLYFWILHLTAQLRPAV
jgi:DHA2 family multidrug resistance protein